MGREAAESLPLAPSSNRAPTSLAPGFRFHPTDEELVIYYLKRKVCGKPFRFNAISEVDIYKSEPWDLADKSSLKSRDQEYYFFSALDKKYGNGARMNRATGQGYWKATGNDRPVLHHSQTVGMKKTLVFHSGRAPDGKRTNWVMHEYRLVEEELEKAGVGATQKKDGFVLCRVFHKNNIGPPSGQRYAPFIEEEWDDDDKSGIVPGIVTGNVVVAGREAYCGGNDRDHHVNGNNNGSCIEQNTPDAHVEVNIVQQETQFVDKISQNALDHPKDKQKVLPVCKIERSDDLPPQCVINQEERLDDYPSPEADDNQTLQLFRYKRKKPNDSDSNRSNASENSSRTTQDLHSSITTAATTTETSTTKALPTRSFLSALVEYSLLESIEPRDTTPAFPPEFDLANLGSSVPPAYLKYIQDLQHKIHKISLERETLKFEMMSAQSMINILQSRIDLLNKENYDLRRSIEDSSG